MVGGITWYDWHSRTPRTGGQSLQVGVDLSSIPMFLRGGSIVPTTAPISVSSAQPFATATRLIIAPDSDCDFVLYQDDGIRTLATTESLRTHVRVKSGPRVEIDISREYTAGLADDLMQSMPDLIPKRTTSDKILLLDIISSQRGAFWCTVERKHNDRALPRTTELQQYLIAEQLHSTPDHVLPPEGWMYTPGDNTVRVQLVERDGDCHRMVAHTKVVVSFDDFNLIGM